MNTENLLEIKDLKWGYESKELISEPLTLKINSPKFILLLGENGSGKSTLLRTIGGIQHPLSGNVFLNNKPTNKNRKSSDISFVFAFRPHVDFMKVSDLVFSGIRNRIDFKGISAEEKDRYESALQQTGAKSVENNYINQISDGEFQKAMISRALLQNSKLILLDEPTAFLDYRSKRNLFEMLSELSQKENKIIISSTHDPDLAQEKGSEFWLIKDKKFNVVQKSELNDKGLSEFLL